MLALEGALYTLKHYPDKVVNAGSIPAPGTNQLLAVRNNGKLKEILGSSPRAGSYLFTQYRSVSTSCGDCNTV